MTSRSNQPPWDFLLSASRNTLQSFEMSRLGHAADIRKEINALIEQWVQESVDAGLARCLLNQREHAVRAAEGRSADASRANGAHSVSDNFFADRSVARPADGGRS